MICGRPDPGIPTRPALVRDRRRALGMTQAGLAQLSKCAKSEIHMMELYNGGTAAVRARVEAALAKAEAERTA